MNSIEQRLAKLNKKAEARVAKRLEAKQKLERKERTKQPHEPNYLTYKQIKEARAKFGSKASCMICMRKPRLYKAHAIDHCHVTGTIRGILCHNCNMALGYLKEDIEIAKSALRYLELHKLDYTSLSDEELERLKLIQNR